MNIDLIPNGAIKRVHVSQNDVGRTLTFELFNNSTSYTIPSGAVVKIQGTKPSGFGFSEVCTVSGNTVTIETTETMTDEYGYIETELVIESSGDVLGTSNFILAVERNPHPDTTTDGSMETIIPELTLLVNEVKGYAEEIEGTYHAYGSPWVASTVAQMTDTDKIYVYTGSETGYTNGNWYYYNGSAWVSGGVYNAVAVNIDDTLTVQGACADAKAVGDKVSVLNSGFRLLNSEYESIMHEAVLNEAVVLANKAVGVVGGAFKLIDNVGTYVIRIPTSVLSVDPFFIIHPNNMILTGTTYQIFWSDSDAFTTSARRSFTTDSAVWRRGDSNNTTYAYIYIPVSSSTVSLNILRPKSTIVTPYNLINENLNNQTQFDITSAGILNYGGTYKISKPFYIGSELYASGSITLYAFNTDGTYVNRQTLVSGLNDVSTFNGKVGVLTYVADIIVSYDQTANIGLINTDYLTTQTGWQDKILYCYGDSITEQGYWQPYLNRICKFASVINGGHSGYRLMLLATDENIDAITDTFDVMVIMAGVNDWTQDRAIGTINDVNTDSQSFTGTFYGGLNQMLNHITTKWADRRFVFVTPTYVYLNDDSKFFNGTGHGDVNSLGLTMRDYADAMINACKKWNVPCIDLLSQIGWNANNIATYVKNDATTVEGVTYANYSHPNTTGAKIMASVISSYLQSIAPIK